MTAEAFSRQVDVSVVITLASLLVVVSSVVLLLDLMSQNSERKLYGAKPLLWGNACCLIATIGLELGKHMPFALSAPIVVSGALFGLVFGYTGLKSALMRRAPSWFWLKIAFCVAAVESLLAILSDSVAAIFVSSSIVNGSLTLYFCLLLAREARARNFRPLWLLFVPFATLGIGYLGRLLLILLGFQQQMIVAASVGIGIAFSVATLFWVFAAITLRSFHLAADLDHAAHHDALTGLSNRMSLDTFKSLRSSGEAVASGDVSACLCLDLDLFKEVNDTYGHETGDAVLLAIAGRLRAVSRDNDRIFRIGGDEFVFWRQCKAGESADELAEALAQEICRPIPFGDLEITVGVSIGLETSDENCPPWTLIRRADIALYESKARGRNCVTHYSDELGKVYDKRLADLSDFREALKDGQITVAFQPQVSLADGRVTGCEALARWEHPEQGNVAPSVFLPLAEELGLLAELDRHVLDCAIHAFQSWSEFGCHVPKVSVNVSPNRLLDPALLNEIAQRKHFPAHAIVFEVLETVFLEASETLRWNVDRLRDMGIGIDVDDFGTGHASLASVLALRPDRIKIDAMFVKDIDTDDEHKALMRSLVDLVVQSGARAIVEGVETDAQLAVLKEIGVREAQGFAIAHPMPFGEATEWLRRRTGESSRCKQTA